MSIKPAETDMTEKEKNEEDHAKSLGFATGNADMTASMIPGAIDHVKNVRDEQANKENAKRIAEGNMTPDEKKKHDAKRNKLAAKSEKRRADNLLTMKDEENIEMTAESKRAAAAAEKKSKMQAKFMCPVRRPYKEFNDARCNYIVGDNGPKAGDQLKPSSTGKGGKRRRKSRKKKRRRKVKKSAKKRKTKAKRRRSKRRRTKRRRRR